MQFNESFEKIKNRIRSFKDVDRSRFRLDLTNGAFFEWNVLWQINSIFNRGDLAMYAIQCQCGRLDIVNNVSFEKFHSAVVSEAESLLKCNLCMDIGVDFIFETEVTQRVHDGLLELHSLFGKAADENYMTLCWYLWKSLGIENEQLREIQSSADLIFDQYIKNNLEVFLQNNCKSSDLI